MSSSVLTVFATGLAAEGDAGQTRFGSSWPVSLRLSGTFSGQARTPLDGVDLRAGTETRFIPRRVLPKFATKGQAHTWPSSETSSF